MRRNTATFFATVVLLVAPQTLWGQSTLRSEEHKNEPPESRSVWAPFAFYSGSTDFLVGVGGAYTGVLGQTMIGQAF